MFVIGGYAQVCALAIRIQMPTYLANPPSLPHRRRVALQFSLMMCNGNGGKEGKESAHAPVA